MSFVSIFHHYAYCVMQVGSLSVGLSASGQPQVLVSQPGGTYRPISCPRGAGGREERGGSEGKE